MPKKNIQTLTDELLALIKANETKAITGQILQDVLLDNLDSYANLVDGANLGSDIAYVSLDGDDVTAVLGSINLPYATIQAAYDAVKVGATVVVHKSVVLLPGTYTEDVTLDTNFVDVVSAHSQAKMYSQDVLPLPTTIFGGARPYTISGTVTITTELGCFYSGWNPTNMVINISGGTSMNYFSNMAVLVSITGTAGDTYNDVYNDVHTFTDFLYQDVIFGGYIKNCMCFGNGFCTGTTSVISGVIEDCYLDDSGFCNEGGTMSGTIKGCTFRGSETLAGSNGGDAGTISGLIENCTIVGTFSLAGNTAAGSTLGTVSGTIRGVVISGLSQRAGGAATLTSTGLVENCDITAGGKVNMTCFNGGVIEGTFRNTTGGVNSFGGNGGSIAATAVFDNIRTTDTNGFAFETPMIGTLKNSAIGGSENPATAVTGGNGGRIYNCTLVSFGAVNSIFAGGAINMDISHCRLNNGINFQISNDIGTPYIINDSNVVV